MTTEPPAGPDAPVALPADRAFLVQFRAGPAGGPAWQPTGRVEHLASGRAARFGDWAALRRFVDRVLREEPFAMDTIRRPTRTRTRGGRSRPFSAGLDEERPDRGCREGRT